MTRAPRTALSTTDHSRDGAGLTYVYPVVSRRTGGLSVGINLNPNNACNWRCIYCQVPNLVRGAAPPIDLAQLERELRGFLTEVVRGDFLARRVPTGMRRLTDLALSGNGEPTSATEFESVIAMIGSIRSELAVDPDVKTVLITNGSLIHRTAVQAGLRRLAALNGEVWFKLDRATHTGIGAVNHTSLTPARVRRNLDTCAGLCPTWIQTCLFAIDGAPPSPAEVDAYVAFLAAVRADAVPLRGVFLYGIARPSLQPEAPRLSRLPETWMRALADRVEALGFPVQVAP
jgi:wyosine [tRNA(Phe)-imidazoG37] synthetase (radical SAM superfamily)